MRFCYIDRTGREVELASMEDLASRIELGVISPETLLYDAAEDQWGPAESHDVYRHLTGESLAAGTVRFRTPPPSERPRPDSAIEDDMDGGVPEDDPTAAGPEGDPSATAPEDPLDADALEDEATTEAPEDEAAPGPDTVGRPVGLSPFDVLEGGPASRPALHEHGEASESLDTGESDEGPSASNPVEASSDEDSTASDDVVSEEVVLAPEEGGEADPPPDMDADRGSELLAAPGSEFMPPPHEPAPAPRVSGSRSLIEEPEIERLPQSPLGDWGPDPEAVPSSRGERTPREPWGSAGEDDSLPPLPVLPEFEAPTRVPSAAARRRAFAGTAGLILLVIVAGWFALRTPEVEVLGEAAVARAAAIRTVITDLAAGADTDEVSAPVAVSLSPRGVEVVQAALGATVAALDSLQEEVRLPQNPGPAWLQGRYLSGASSFPEVREYWAEYREYLEHSREAHSGLFERALVDALDSIAVNAADRSRLRGEALAWFEGARPQHESTYDRMAALAEAALELHRFLVVNESRIDYEPVRIDAVSRDPILEAVPQDDEVAEGLWSRLDRITYRLEEIQGLRAVSTTGLMESLFNDLIGDRSRGAGPDPRDSLKG